LAGQPGTEKAINIKPFPWLSVVRHFNVLLKLIYGPAYEKTYKRVYQGGRLRKRRVYRIPLLNEYEEATRTQGVQDVAKVA